MLILKGESDAGITYLQKCGEVETREGLLFLAAAHTLARQYTNAIAIYREMLQKDSQAGDVFDIRRELGGVYLRQSLYNEALEELNAALVMQPDNARLMIELAELHVAMKDIAAARARLSAIPQDSPEKARAQEMLDRIK
jgi:tetratricopeptide (TPR) repeat protein